MTIVPLAGQPFGVTKPLAPGAANYGGARRVLEALTGIFGKNSRNSASLVGPRQSGKSSFLNQLQSKQHLARVEGGSSALVAFVDAREVSGRSSDLIPLLITALANAANSAGLSADDIRNAISMGVAIDGAHRVRNGPVLVLIDNFDRVASDLDRDQQFELRQAVERRDAAYVLSTRLPLETCMQHWYKNDGSDFSEICPASLGSPLEPLLVHEVEEVIRGGLGGEAHNAQGLAAWIHQMVGGHPPWVQRALASVVRPGPSSDLVPWNQRPMDELAEQVFQESIDFFLRGFRRLHGQERAYLQLLAERTMSVGTGEGQMPLTMTRELQRRGWITIRPDNTVSVGGEAIRRWLLEKGVDADSASDQSEDRVEQLIRVVSDINQVYWSKRGSTQGRPLIRKDVFSSPKDYPFLRRRVRNEDDFGRFVLSLFRLLAEGTGFSSRAGARPQLGLPSLCYSDPSCVVRQVCVLRHRWAHLLPEDAVEAARELEVEKRVFDELCGRRPDCSDDWERAADALWTRTLAFLRAVAQHVPFAEQLDARVLYARD